LVWYKRSATAGQARRHHELLTIRKVIAPIRERDMPTTRSGALYGAAVLHRAAGST
jgi:hypothetical protein